MIKTKSAGPAKAILCATIFSLAWLAQVQANTFGYTNGNVLICFRKAATGASDLVVNAGPIATFTNLAPNATITITAYTGSQLAPIGTNNIAWSAWAYFDNSAPLPAGMTNTIYMTNPRSDLNTPTTPYYRDTSSAQGQTIGKLKAIAAGAVNNANFSGLNSSTAVLESESYNLNNSAVSYYTGLGNNLNFNDTFQQQPDQYTPANFTTSATPSRSDLYWISPTANTDHSQPDAKFIGYFQLATNGVMTYTAYPTATVAAPVILGFTRTGGTSTVTFTTGSSGTYTLRGTNSAGLTAARTNWPAINSVAGDGGNHSLSDTTTATNQFYIISAQ
jgi:hypothetical protein